MRKSLSTREGRKLQLHKKLAKELQIEQKFFSVEIEWEAGVKMIEIKSVEFIIQNRSGSYFLAY